MDCDNEEDDNGAEEDEDDEDEEAPSTPNFASSSIFGRSYDKRKICPQTFKDKEFLPFQTRKGLHHRQFENSLLLNRYKSTKQRVNRRQRNSWENSNCSAQEKEKKHLAETKERHEQVVKRRHISRES